MQLNDFFNNAGNGLVDTVRTVFFRMLPRGAQIDKVRQEINAGLLKKYGKMTGLKIDKENKIIGADLELKGEGASIQIKVSNYRLVQEESENPVFEFGTIESSREAILKISGSALSFSPVQTSVFSTAPSRWMPSRISASLALPKLMRISFAGLRRQASSA